MLSYVFSAASSYVFSSAHADISSQSHDPHDLCTSIGLYGHHRFEPSFDSIPSSSSTSSSRRSSTWESNPSSSSSSSSSLAEDFLEGLSSSSAAGPSFRPGTPKQKHQPPATPSDRYDTINHILEHDDLYVVLGTPEDGDGQQLRRAYITRSKRCHPDKFPEYPSATLAFQKVSFAYDTLSDPRSRRAYDKGRIPPSHSPTHFRNTSHDADERWAHYPADDTLNGVLYGVFCDFMDGDYEMVRTFLRAMGELNSRLRVGDETIESLLESMMRLRQILLAGQKYVRIVRFELIRMYEIQSSLRALSYFDVRGRLRLTFQLARVTLSLPVVVDLAMRKEDSDSEDDELGGEGGRKRRGLAGGKAPSRVKVGSAPGRQQRGILPPPVRVVIGLAIGALEVGERVL